jgi:hypothetical protein
MSEIETLVKSLLAEKGVRDACARYATAMDSGDDATWVDCFTADGVFDVRLPDGSTLRRPAGRAELTAFIAAFPRPAGSFIKHLSTNLTVTADGDRATAQSEFLAIGGTPGEPSIGSVGRCRDTLVRGPDGIWRFQERIAETEAAATVWKPAT